MVFSIICCLNVSLFSCTADLWFRTLLFLPCIWIEQFNLWSLVLISHLPTCNVVTSWNWQCSTICSSGSLAHLWWIVNILKFVATANQILYSTIFNFYGSNHLPGVRTYVHRCCSCIKQFHHQQPLACLPSWTQLNFAIMQAVNAWDRLWFGDKPSLKL